MSIAKQIERLENQINSYQAGIAAAERALDELRPKLQAELETAELARQREQIGYAAGTPVAFEFGRGESRTKLTGLIIAFAPKNDKVPATYAIQTGTGIDTKVVKVPAVAVTLIEEQGT